MKIGDFVKLKNSENSGEISKILSKKQVEIVLQNGFIVKVNISEIESSLPPEQPKKQKKKFKVNIPPPKVDLHIEVLFPNFKGMSNAEIIRIQLEEFESKLDAAIASGMLEITFIHGIGAGVLRNEIRKILSENKNVKSFMDAHYDRGSTVARFY